MLFDRWQDTLSRFRHAPALFEGGRSLSFGDLAGRLAALPAAANTIIARGTPTDIVLAVLQAWRDGQAVLPLEASAPPPDLTTNLPAGTAHLKLTPGIEGKPRAVFFTADQIAADADRLVAAMNLRPGIPNLAAISLTHSYGFSSILLPLLLHGVPVHAVEVPFPKVMADAIDAHDAVVLPAVPSMWRAWHRAGFLRPERIALAVSAGAPLSLELEHAVFANGGLKLHNFYGASECGGISFDASDTPRTSAADLGTPLDGVAVTLDASGRFHIASSSVALGYQAARDGEVLGGGSFLTQDHGRIKGGHLLLDSSGAESINVAGRKIGPAKIEAALMATGLLEKARVFGVPSHDPERVEEITALVKLKSGTLDQLRQRMSGTLEGWEMPRHWMTPEDDALWQLSRADLKKRHR